MVVRIRTRVQITFAHATTARRYLVPHVQNMGSTCVEICFDTHGLVVPDGVCGATKGLTICSSNEKVTAFPVDSALRDSICSSHSYI